MRAVVVEQPGGPRDMVVADVPDPVPGPGEVLIDVAAVGVNRADLLQRQGLYPPPPGVSEILGLEVSGTVAELGPGARRWKPGDRVCALLAGGGYAERAVAPVAQVMPLPAGMDTVSAASLPEAACTVWSNLTLVARLGAGEWVLIHGGGSGIGTFAIQYAAALGAHVAVTAGSPQKLQRCAHLGAEVGIDYRREDFPAALADATGGHGADVILDVVGAKYLDRNIRALASGGRLVVIGLQGGVRGELNLGGLLGKQGTISATSLRSRPLDEKARICAEVEACVWPMVEAARIVPVVHEVLPLAEAARAHEILADSSHVGKVVLRVDAS